MEKEIKRTNYLKALNAWKDKHVIKIITGIRRSGKSTLLRQYINELINVYKINSNQLIVYDFNNPKLSKYSYESLYDEIISKANKTKTNYLFLDEVQEIKEFERCVIGLYEHKTLKFDICITGSNSHMFSNQLATLFTGRNIEIKVYPFSFKEYFDAFESKLKYKTKAFYQYMKYGGLPAIFEFLDDEKLIQKKLLNIFNDCLNKDVEKRHKIKNKVEFEKICKYLFDHIGQPISTFKISNTLKTKNKSKISHNTINRYIEWLKEAILLYRVYYYTTIGKRSLETAGKIFAADIGLRNALNKFQEDNIGSILENIVYLELLKRKSLLDEIYVGKLYDGREIDFIIESGKQKTYIQVANDLDSEKTKKREIGNLRSINDSHPKIVLVLYGDSCYTDDGIKINNLIDWLLDND